MKKSRKVQKKINKSGLEPCEICNTPNILVEHHIRGRDIPNPNHYSNRAYICSNCHTEIHHGKIIVESRVFTTEGYKLIWHHKGEESITGYDAKPFLIV